MCKMAQQEWWFMTVESVRLTRLLLPSLEDLLKKQERRTELSVSWEASIECQSRWRVNFSKISKRSSHPCTRHCCGIGIQRFPQVIQVFLLLWGCSILCSWSSSRSLAAARAGGAGSPLNFLFLVIKAASPHNQCSQYYIHYSQIECQLDSHGSWNNFLICSEWKNLFNYIWNQSSSWASRLW